jgi:ubiquinone/menaquinone biosynthesis C-methylase UbiE
MLIPLLGAAAWRLFVNGIHRQVIERLGLAPGISVLDVGCGPGRLDVHIGRAIAPDGEVVAVDPNLGATRAAERRAKLAGLRNVHVLHGAVGTGQIVDEARFDRAVLVAVLGEIRNRPAAMREILRALRPGGRLCVTEVAVDPHRRRPDDVRRLAAAAGFIEEAADYRPLAFTLTFSTPAHAQKEADDATRCPSARDR